LELTYDEFRTIYREVAKSIPPIRSPSFSR
jgi:hypothetical protein